MIKGPGLGTAMSTPKSCSRSWAIAQHLPNPEHISFWNNIITQQTKFSQLTGMISHKDKRGVTLMVLGITALITALAGICYGVISNHEISQNLTKV
jgi:hypothetical protein